MSIEPRIDLEPASRRASMIMLLLTVVLPVLLTFMALLFVGFKDTATPRMIEDGMPAPLALILLAEILLTAGLWYVLERAMRRHRIEWQPDTLTVVTSFYRQRYQKSDLLLDGAAIVDLENDKEHRPVFKTNGYSVPGFNSGWFRLRNRQSAFCAIGAGKRILMIPTGKGHCLMLGTNAPEKALEQLRQWVLA